MKISQYQLLFNKLPHVNKATLQALINHLYWWVTHTHTCRNPLVSVCGSVCAHMCSPFMSFSVQRFSELNQMNLHNLAIVFGPTLFQTDGKDYTAGRAIEDLIQHYTSIFEVRLTAQWQTGWWQEGLTYCSLSWFSYLKWWQEEMAHNTVESAQLWNVPMPKNM